METTPTFSVSIMGHPSRLDYFPALSEPFDPVFWVVDGGHGIWPTCRGAWQTRDRAADYHLVLQDDAILCADFVERLTRLLADTQRPAYSLYFGYRRNYVETAKTGLEAGFVELPYLHWGLAVCLHRDLIEPMLAFGEASTLPSTHDDTRIKTFLLERGIPVYYPLPSLVDHRTDTVSLATGEPTEPVRHAFYFAGE